MLDYTDSAVTRNASEKKINSLLDFISTSTDLDLLQARGGGWCGGVGFWGEQGDVRINPLSMMLAVALWTR